MMIRGLRIAIIVGLIAIAGTFLFSFGAPEMETEPLPGKFDAALTRSLRGAVTAQEVWREEHGSYAGIHDGLELHPDPGTSLSVIFGTADTYCIQGGDHDGDHAHVTAEQPAPVPGFCPASP
jgi:hypothetical protein